jgi:short subunit dehydrogenase-like uncharacterized protein
VLVVYGATGYTGRLIVEEALARGIRPVLAGRSAEALRAQAEPLGLAWRAAALDDAAALDRALDGAAVVLHCAGPFVHTWRAVADACLRAGARGRPVHYLDITGEIAVFEALAARGPAAAAAGVMLLPGVGFDVVPSDCLAAHLARRVPGAERLALAFRTLGRPSRGTLATMVENLGSPGAVRRGGRIVSVPPAWRTRTVDFGDGRPVAATTIPWGDVSTAWHSTGIADVEVYMAMPATLRRLVALSRFAAPLLASGVVRRLAGARVRAGPPGPDGRGAGARRELALGRGGGGGRAARRGAAARTRGLHAHRARRGAPRPPGAGRRRPARLPDPVRAPTAPTSCSTLPGVVRNDVT